MSNFTSSHYFALLRKLTSRYRLVRFGEEVASEPAALWRHDIDFSPQRALAMAKQEADSGVRATYFVQVSSRYYSVFEPETAAIIRAIGALGHDIGLHFDPEVCKHKNNTAFEGRIKFEAAVLSEIAEMDVSVFSLHNPTTFATQELDTLKCAGLLNASASIFRALYTYCSDSNGLWRFASVESLIADPAVTKLYTLTHPEWWQETDMLPREKIQRCINGRAIFCEHYYDDLLAVNSRPNVRSI
jgi:hypothetical protein